MDARVFFEHVVKPNYHEALNSSRDFRAIWNAFHSVNTAIEAVALERVQYAQGQNIVDEKNIGRTRIAFRSQTLHRSVEARSQTNAQRHCDFHKYSSI
jgi:hypothetical protein